MVDLDEEVPLLFAPTYTCRPPQHRGYGRARNRHLKSV